MGVVFGGADLHAPEAASGVEDEVVAVGVSPGLGDAEAKADGFSHKSKFGEFSAAFGRVLVLKSRFLVAGFLGMTSLFSVQILTQSS
jgi:hypothetical protein